jgi:hypothetical protein
MPAIEATKAKLAEAEFFYRKLSAVQQRLMPNEPEAFGFYLSAFLSAARSVTFALQAEQKQEYEGLTNIVIRGISVSSSLGQS